MHPDITKTIAAMQVDDKHAAAAARLARPARGCLPRACRRRRVGVRISGQ
jgi:hypothetical protein